MDGVFQRLARPLALGKPRAGSGTNFCIHESVVLTNFYICAQLIIFSSEVSVILEALNKCILTDVPV